MYFFLDQSSTWGYLGLCFSRADILLALAWSFEPLRRTAGIKAINSDIAGLSQRYHWGGGQRWGSCRPRPLLFMPLNVYTSVCVCIPSSLLKVCVGSSRCIVGIEGDSLWLRHSHTQGARKHASTHTHTKSVPIASHLYNVKYIELYFSRFFTSWYKRQASEGSHNTENPCSNVEPILSWGDLL